MYDECIFIEFIGDFGCYVMFSIKLCSSGDTVISPHTGDEGGEVLG